MRVYPHVMILTTSRPICDLGYDVLALAAIAVTELPKGKSLTRTFGDLFEVHIERTGKYGVIGSYGGEEFEGIYADAEGREIRVRFLANVERLKASAAVN